jgi:hypothetical protein
MIDNIVKLAQLNNQFYTGRALSLAMGAATSRPGERLESVVRRADAVMYEAKGAYYSDSQNDRREPVVSRALRRPASASRPGDAALG